MTPNAFRKNRQYYRFSLYGFLKNLRLFEPFLMLFFLENGLSFLQIGVLYSLLEIIRNLTEIPSGFLADLIGRKNTLVASFFFYLASFIIFYLATSFLLLALAMGLFAIGDAFRTGTHKAMIFHYLKIQGWQDQKVNYYGHTRSWSQAGSAVSALLAGILVFWQGNYRIIFLITLLPYILDLVNVATYPSVLNRAQPKKKPTAQKIIQGFRTSFSQKLTLKTLFSMASFSGYYKATKDYLQPVVQTLALSLPWMVAYAEKERTAVLIGIIYFFIYLLTSRASLRSGRFKDRLKNFGKALNITLFAGLLAGFLAGLFFELEWIAPAILFYIFIFIVENLRKPVGVAFLAEKTDEDVMATTLSVESQSKSLVAAVVAPLLGYAADLFGLGYGLMVVSLILLIPGLILRLKTA
jgi:MFS family permease